MARRSFMSARAGEAAQELGRKSSTEEGAKSILDGFDINIENVSSLKGDDIKVARAIIQDLATRNAGLWAMIFQAKDVSLVGNEIQISLHRYKVGGKEKSIIRTFTCAKYIAAILRSAKTLGLLKTEITGKTVTADSDVFTVYFTPQGVEKPKEPTEEQKS